MAADESRLPVDGGTRLLTITDAEGKKFDVYHDHRFMSKGSGERFTTNGIYLFAYPGHSSSVRVLNEHEFNKKIWDFK